jgi:hypothetical protein
MSGPNIDNLMKLWAATLATHDDVPPFSSHKEMYEKIDSTPLGDVRWENFSIKYDGVLPDDNVPEWMTAKYDVSFRDPLKLVHNLLSNPDFKDEFDYVPFQEYDKAGNHRFQDFMSGNWAWEQCVRVIICVEFQSDKRSGFDLQRS